MEPELTFPQLIKIERVKLDMTQEEFADAMGVSRPTIARWETGGVVTEKSLAAAAMIAQDVRVRESAARLLAAFRDSQDTTALPVEQ